jgi:hypothetical protein
MMTLTKSQPAVTQIWYYITARYREVYTYYVYCGSGAHTASYPMGNGVDFPGGKAAGA